MKTNISAWQPSPPAACGQRVLIQFRENDSVSGLFGQTPHLPIGKQIASSSLHHPPIPGFNDRHFQKLLYTWRLLPADSPCHCYNDYNSENIFAETDPPAAAHCLMLSGGKKQYGVFLLANCSGHPITASYSLAAPFDKFRLFRIPGYPEPAVNKPFSMEVTASLVAEEPATGRISPEKKSPYPPAFRKNAVEYQRELKRQQDWGICRRKGLSYRSSCPAYHSHEQSLGMISMISLRNWRVKQPDGQYKSLGFVSKKVSKNIRRKPCEYARTTFQSKAYANYWGPVGMTWN